MDLLFSSPLTLAVIAVIIGAHVAVAIVVRRMVRTDIARRDAAVGDDEANPRGPSE